jgi:lipid A 4'-phosphatase
MKNYYQKYIFIWIWALTALCIIFFIFPELDIQISKIFYTEKEGFFYAQNAFVQIVFQLVPLLTYTAAIIYFTIGLYQYFIYKKFSKILLYLIVTLIIGPGILVNSVLKNNFGRARPKNIIEFGGNSTFHSLMVLSNQCSTNCSFSSGHAAAAYYFTNISFILPHRRQKVAFYLAMAFGTLVGIMRIMQGGHFASDVLFSCLIVLLVNYFCKKLIIYPSYFDKLG